MNSSKKEFARKVGRKLEDFRKQLGHSRSEMASRLGITPSAYHKNESGVNLPGHQTLMRLSLDYDISMDWLYCDRGPQNYGSGEQKIKKMKEQIADLEANAPQSGSNLLKRPEVEELLAAMEKNPILYYEMMLKFQRYRAGSGQPGN